MLADHPMACHGPRINSAATYVAWVRNVGFRGPHVPRGKRRDRYDNHGSVFCPAEICFRGWNTFPPFTDVSLKYTSGPRLFLVENAPRRVRIRSLILLFPLRFFFRQGLFLGIMREQEEEGGLIGTVNFEEERMLGIAATFF